MCIGTSGILLMFFFGGALLTGGVGAIGVCTWPGVGDE